jgi:hypothetical protein
VLVLLVVVVAYRGGMEEAVRENRSEVVFLAV